MSASRPGLNTTDISVRDLLSSLTALHMLSMVMTDNTREDAILDLAVSALPSLSRRCHAEAIWLEGEWQSVDCLRGHVGPRAGLEVEISNVGPAGGAVELGEGGWAWAYPLTSRGASGYLVVGAPDEPAAHEQSLLRALAQQTGVALANARLVNQERATRARLADEQATLRRVAALVAQAAAPADVFAAVAAEAARLLDADVAVMSRYDEHGAATILGAWTHGGTPQRLPSAARLEELCRSLDHVVFATDSAARVEDHGRSIGAGVNVVERSGARTLVGVPIHIERRLWGLITVGSRLGESLPPDTETWLAGFAELVATAIANAEAQAALTASRARIAVAADNARHRIERDLHDGAQQRLVSLGLRLRALQAGTPQDASQLADELEQLAQAVAAATEELREIAHGIHPASLVNRGLVSALRDLARRCPFPVSVDVSVDERLPEPIELACYYVVAETLTNAQKHAGAASVGVDVIADAGAVHVRVCDDGRGGADITRGSGLVGLKDRVETLGGRMSLHSPLGAGTQLEIMLPRQNDSGQGAPRSEGRAS